MKIPRLLKHNKLWAATARRSSAASAGMDFEEMPEPNMKLSRALLIVLLLHVVAVSGIIAFNAIKTRESSFVPASSTKVEPKPSTTKEATSQTDGAKPQTAAARKENAPSDDPKPSHSPKLASKDDHPNASSDADRPSHKATAGKPVSDGKTYVVKKGDNPVTIAKKLRVSVRRFDGAQSYRGSAQITDWPKAVNSQNHKIKKDGRKSRERQREEN